MDAAAPAAVNCLCVEGEEHYVWAVECRRRRTVLRAHGRGAARRVGFRNTPSLSLSDGPARTPHPRALERVLVADAQCPPPEGSLPPALRGHGRERRAAMTPLSPPLSDGQARVACKLADHDSKLPALRTHDLVGVQRDAHLCVRTSGRAQRAENAVATRCKAVEELVVNARCDRPGTRLAAPRWAAWSLRVVDGALVGW